MFFFTDLLCYFVCICINNCKYLTKSIKNNIVLLDSRTKHLQRQLGLVQGQRLYASEYCFYNKGIKPILEEQNIPKIEKKYYFLTHRISFYNLIK